MNIYDLSRYFWNYSFENPEKIKPNHIAIYFYAIELCNRLGWKEKFGFPTTRTMESIGIKDYKTYSKAFNELVSLGFIHLIEKSKNQHSANIISLVNFKKQNISYLDMSIMCSGEIPLSDTLSNDTTTTPSEPTVIIPINNNTKITNVAEDVAAELKKISDLKKTLKSNQIQMDRVKMQYKLSNEDLDNKINEFVEKKVSWGDDNWRNNSDMAKNFEFWLNKNPRISRNSYKDWSRKEFFEEIPKACNGITKNTLQEFFEHYSQPTADGLMLFQSFPAWDTKTRMKKWIGRN